MRCKYCNAKLATHDIWCVECGRQTTVVKQDLASMRSLGNTYSSFKAHMSSAVPGSAFSLILGIIPLAVLIWVFSSIIPFDNESVGGLLLGLLIKSVSLSIFIPFVLIGFNAISLSETYTLSWQQIIAALNSYPRYLLFSLVSAAYYTVLFLICWGVPGFASLPILHLVWLVMVVYWVAIILPAPVLMERLGLSPWQAITKAYHHFHDVRWNIFLLALVLALLNAVAFLLLFVPMVVTLPLSLYAIRDYTNRLVEYELLDYRR